MEEKKKSAASWGLTWAGQKKSSYVWSVILAPIIVIVYFFMIDWRLALFSFIPIIVGFATYMGKLSTVIGEVTGILEQPELERPKITKAQPKDNGIKVTDITSR